MSGAILFIIALFWISTAIGVGYDARKHGGSFVKWFLIVGVTGIFGLMWYSIAHNRSPQPRTDTDRTLLVSSEVVDVETKEKTVVQLSVPTDSTTFAIEQFELKCRKSGYQPTEKPNIEVQ
ncbi:hypothetical protein C440_00305 [Haloferax mucosum ATCC BAA-1512]|uniref:Cardiolipin synthase N-terminal domain-containing protein n=1 Tax=Haloferax mucosum ATCC BAA-1512 TaxID=662479 RepID=M0IPJ7_9EURY|nr:hypothetical protein [Haloferax mucosum]ELZ98751.1 hypothetical protein C440_00305 [Haloferax mucosum ATCC BAA-1512]